MLTHEESVRLYGPWAPRTPADAAELLREYPGRWWIAGGWAIDAYVGSSRDHGDLDLGIPRDELRAFLAFMSGRLDVWAAHGSLTPITAGAALPDACGNLWLRAGGADPWEYDILLEHVRGDTWTYKRDSRISRPLDECVWQRDGQTYLRPETQLLLKSRHLRPKDTFDFERVLPHLDATHRKWLADSLRVCDPDHVWLAAMAGS